MSQIKEFLGDGLYIDFDGYSLVITSENGTPTPLARIVLEPDMPEKILAYKQRIEQALEELHKVREEKGIKGDAEL
jgi:hypothetical protein